MNRIKWVSLRKKKQCAWAHCQPCSCIPNAGFAFTPHFLFYFCLHFSLSSPLSLSLSLHSLFSGWQTLSRLSLLSIGALKWALSEKTFVGINYRTWIWTTLHKLAFGTLAALHTPTTGHYLCPTLGRNFLVKTELWLSKGVQKCEFNYI